MKKKIKQELKGKEGQRKYKNYKKNVQMHFIIKIVLQERGYYKEKNYYPLQLSQ